MSISLSTPLSLYIFHKTLLKYPLTQGFQFQKRGLLFLLPRCFYFSLPNPFTCNSSPSNLSLLFLILENHLNLAPIFPQQFLKQKHLHILRFMFYLFYRLKHMFLLLTLLFLISRLRQKITLSIKKLSLTKP